MTTFPQSGELPQQFHTITTIRSAEFKTKLTERIVAIFKLIKFFDSFEPNQRTITKVNRFFTYLTQSCAAETTINVRARWLLVYATSVELYLLEIQQGSLLTRIPNDLPSDHQLVNLLQHLESLLTKYISFFRPLNSYAFSVTLDNLVSLGALTVVETDNLKYGNLSRATEAMIDTLITALTIPAIPSFDRHQNLLYQLRHIRYLICEYVLTRVT